MLAGMEHAVAERIALPAWIWLVAAMAVMAIYVLAMDNGVALANGASTVHELFHDARHFVGVPCH